MLAIDRLGVNSLYWRKEGDRILFASRAGAIRSAQEAPRGCQSGCAGAVHAIQRRPAPMAIYHGIEKLRPGFYLIYEAGQIAQTRYWDPPVS